MDSRTTLVGVIGAGLMGAGIAEVCARAGSDVVVVDVSTSALDAGRRRIEESLDRAVTKGKLPDADRAAALARLHHTLDLDDLADRELVVEAASEVEAIKVDLFARLDAVVKSPDAVLASNTSSIPIAKLATATTRPGQVLGLHFFNPVPVMGLVEIVPSMLTTDAAKATAEQFASVVLGKRVITCQDRAGFVVNALLVPYLLAAVRMVESGAIDPTDIDDSMRLGCGHPMGPLALCDLIGLDTVASIADSLFEEFREPLYAPPPRLRRMVDAGLLGRKTGRGFYTYTR